MRQATESRQGSLYRLSRIVPAGFGTILLLMVGIGVATRFSVSRLVQTVNWVSHTNEVKADINELEKILVDAETGQRGFLYTSKENFLEPYLESLKIYQQELNSLKRLVADNPEQVKRVEELEVLIQRKFDDLAKTIDLKRSGKDKEVQSHVVSGYGNQVMDEIREKLATMLETENDLLKKREQDASGAEQFSNLTSIGGTSVAVALGLLIIWFIINYTISSINQAASTIAASSSQIAASMEEQERVTSQQVTAVHETSTTMDELSAASRQSAEQAEATASGVKQVLTLVDGSGNGSDNASSLRRRVGQIAEQILRLSEQTSQIGNISTLVSDLANQTNMLALNAAVEAVRAGEHGKGFGVVAAEIRKLADQSKKSAERINTLVIDIQNATNSTVMVSDEGTKTVESIVNAINAIALSNQQISLTTKQQVIAIQQVVEAMTVINQGAAQTATGISQTRVGTQNLHEAAQILKAVV